MSASPNHSLKITAHIELDGSVFVATSPQLAGLLVVSKDRRKLEEVLIPQAITDLYAACGVEMIVTRIAPDVAMDEWVATPITAIPKEKLAVVSATR